ncbi:MAG: hypothetical protein FJX62_11705 [Alphaproteobacteria bacterium]|nr:hypothetical protein [Alphaproteobacteria bacterium]
MPRPYAKAVHLEDSAAWARQAFVCAYSSSAEYEAETIATRRAAGAYGKPWMQPHTALTIYAIVAGAVFLLAALYQA